MDRYDALLSTKQTAQTEPIFGREAEMVQNNAGGYVFSVDVWQRVTRFLILGSAGNTYYQTAQKLTRENAGAILDALKADPKRLIDLIVDVSDKGRAPKNDPALFALALVATHGELDARKQAFEVLPKVARIGTHLLHFAAYMDSLGGWGRLKREGVSAWYTEKDADRLGYQLVKYQSRDGWSHSDVLRLAHPKTESGAHNNLFRYVRQGFNDTTVKGATRAGANLGELPGIVQAFEAAKTASKPQILKLIKEHGLTMEMIPTSFHRDTDVWEALLESAGITNIIRNLGRLTNIGLIAPFSKATREIAAKLRDGDLLRKGRVHPIQVLYALKTYAECRGFRGSLSWTPVPQIVDALDDAFYLAFDAIEPTGKNTLLGIDVSGSMSWSYINKSPDISAREAAAAMAMVAVKLEPQYHALGFSTELVDVGLTPKMRLEEVVRKLSSVRMGRTDCAQPILWATRNRVPVDVFHVYTDCETWAGGIHVTEALKAYRQSSGRDAKVVVVGFTSTGFTIADPNDRGMLDVVGFDTSAPAVMAEFARGNL